MSDYDVEVSEKYVMCGGDLTYSQNVRKLPSRS